jgi:hypothetical protein
MTPDDMMISAWLDGTLDTDGAARMTELAANDEAFALRVQRLRHLDNLVRAAVPVEPEIPAALLARLGLAEAPVRAEPMRADVVDFAAARQQRAQQQAARQPVPESTSRFGRSAFLKVAAQVAIIAGVGLSVAVFNMPGQKAGEPSAEYRTLSSAPDTTAHEANALVRFAPGIAASDAQRIAGAAGVRLVGTPNAAGAWKAVVAPGRRTAVLDALRADQRVSLAEPIDGGTP